jgi:hypothetical protein
MFWTVFPLIIRSLRLYTHTATGICQTDTAACLLAGTRWNWFQPVPSRSHLIPDGIIGKLSLT